MTLLSITLVLFLIMDPIGNIKPFLTMMHEIPPNRQRVVVFREMLIALAAMMIFSLLGEYIFEILQISETTVRLSAGIILFLIALQILFPSKQAIRSNLPKEEPFITPLAIPLIAGPSLLATILLYSHLVESYALMFSAILIAWLVASIILLFSKQIQNVLGDNGLLACEKLMGMILIMLAIQRFMEGVQLLLTTA